MTSKPTSPDSKERGAFFTPWRIAEYLVDWALGDRPDARILDPTCGEAVFLLAAGEKLLELGRRRGELHTQLFGIDVHGETLSRAEQVLNGHSLSATMLLADFFHVSPPDRIDADLPEMDAVVGNPPFIRYQNHSGIQRAKSLKAAMAQGVRLSGLASSWASVLVHASSFLSETGRLAMVLPAELMSVQYAEPIRRWLKERFASVHLLMFEKLQFDSALEKVVLLLAQGTGGCDAFSLHLVTDAEALPRLRPFDHIDFLPTDEGKWTEVLLSRDERSIFRSATRAFSSLGDLARVELGTVTGANDFFALTEQTKNEYHLEERHLCRISPPGTKHLPLLDFTQSNWEALRDQGFRVWLLHPQPEDADKELRDYLIMGEEAGVPSRYKCRIRDPWWRPPLTQAPDLFFTYMSHLGPRLIANTADVHILNSMHGVVASGTGRREIRTLLPIASMNSITLLGAELFGRSYGGGILKMEPREAARLPVPSLALLKEADVELLSVRTHDSNGDLLSLAEEVDSVLVNRIPDIDAKDMSLLREGAGRLRQRRLSG